MICDIPQKKKTDTGNPASWRWSLPARCVAAKSISISDRTESRAACLLVRLLWIHATVAIYNVEPAGDGWFNGCRETFLVIEPMRQVNATTVARALHCTKPQLDQIRRGKGDTTIPTLKGTIVHALFDRLLDGDTDLEGMYAKCCRSTSCNLPPSSTNRSMSMAFVRMCLRHAAILSFLCRSPSPFEE